jgi:hypothetical protein
MTGSDQSLSKVRLLVHRLLTFFDFLSRIKEPISTYLSPKLAFILRGCWRLLYAFNIHEYGVTLKYYDFLKPFLPSLWVSGLG